MKLSKLSFGPVPKTFPFRFDPNTSGLVQHLKSGLWSYPKRWGFWIWDAGRRGRCRGASNAGDAKSRAKRVMPEQWKRKGPLANWSYAWTRATRGFDLSKHE